MEEHFLEFALDYAHVSVAFVDPRRTLVSLHHGQHTQFESLKVGAPLSGFCGKTDRTLLATALDLAFKGQEDQVLDGTIFDQKTGGGVIKCVPFYGDSTDKRKVTHVALIAEAQDDAGLRARIEQDPVTGLLNRRMLPLITKREISRGLRTRPTIAMLFIMLREFKQINQMYGHQIGDLLLENTGIRVREKVRTSDYVFRWEGTNLVVLLPELATRLDAAVVAEKIHSAVTVPYRFRNHDLAPGCHIGIAIFPDDAEDADSLFNAANSAVIEAERRKEPFRYFDADTHLQASDRLVLKTGLQRAFERSELELYYQPIVSPDGTLCGAEALMRWNHPTRGLLGPGNFIEVAEDTRLIVPIDTFALYQACRLLVDTHDLPWFFVSLNISAINLSDDTLPSVVRQAISDTGLQDSSRLKLELTESRTIENASRSQLSMEEIGAMGVDIWIDDFGTGQSSLSYLKHLPASTVKIDKDFVTDLTTHAPDREYLEGIVNTVRSRGKRIVIEGVSSVDHYALVRDLQVDYLQGYYFGRPMPRRELEALLKE
ncbi:MAG: bifunctional diguanylate cyclase/phosphodiesterase [Spirochaetales bacterium]|nr:bifunctional diguanylate cyclase/phosphodiesterase [Spirochaetales bacterium]